MEKVSELKSNFKKFKSNFKERVGKNLQNIDEESITRVIKTYDNLYDKNIEEVKEEIKVMKEEIKVMKEKINAENIKNVVIHLATMLDLIYINNVQKGGDSERECPVCFNNKSHDPPIDIVDCPAEAENKHGCCKLCWLTWWESKGFGVNNGFECPTCRKRLQLHDDKFNTIPEEFKEFMQNINNLDMKNEKIRKVVDAVEIRAPGDLSSHLNVELKSLNPQINNSIREMVERHRLTEQENIREFILAISITVVVQAYAYNHISSNQSILLMNRTPSFTEAIHGMIREYFTVENAEPPQNPLEAIFLSFIVIVCFILEYSEITFYSASILRDRTRLRRIIQEGFEGIMEQEEQEGGKRKRKTKKGRKSMKNKSKKNKSKKVKRNAHKKK